jgi:hypothetical protein
VLAMICLFVLRRKEPGLFRPYLTPVFPWMPIFVALVSALAGYLYVWANVQVIVPTAALYGVALAWYAIRGRHNVLAAAPEEVAARIAEKLAQAAQTDSAAIAVPRRKSAIEYATAAILVAGLLSLVWMILRATNVIPGPPAEVEILLAIAVWGALFILVSVVGFYSTRPQ